MRGQDARRNDRQIALFSPPDGQDYPGAGKTPETGRESRRNANPERCPECQGILPFGRPRKYCSDRCKTAAWEREHPRVDVSRGLTRAERILERLRQGPATGLDLLRAGGGTRYGARLLELRRDGHQIVTDTSGEWPVYRLEE